MTGQPADYGPLNLLIELVRTCEATDWYDVCTCQVEDPDDLLGTPVRVGEDCKACQWGMKWRAAYTEARQWLDGNRIHVPAWDDDAPHNGSPGAAASG